MTTDTLALPRTETDTRPGTPPPVWLKKEDSWAILIGLGLVIATTALFLAGGSGITAYFSFGVKGWTTPADLAAQLPGKIPGALGLYLLLAAVLGTGARSLGYHVQR